MEIWLSEHDQTWYWSSALIQDCAPSFVESLGIPSKAMIYCTVLASLSSILGDNETNSLRLCSFSWLSKFCQMDPSRGKRISLNVGQITGWVEANKVNTVDIRCRKEEGVSQLDGFSW